MIFNFRNFFLSAVFIAILAGCSSKTESTEYDMPAMYWYNKMLNQITSYDLEGADDTYISLESEHRNSPLIPAALMIMANAHIDEEEYLLANYYLDEYIKRFAMEKDIDYVRYLKIKANFYAFESQFREQQLMDETIEQINEFVQKFPTSPYIFLAKDMQSRLYMAKATLDQEIGDLYTRLEKPEAAKYYYDKVKNNYINVESIEEINVPWYRWLFE